MQKFRKLLRSVACLGIIAAMVLGGIPASAAQPAAEDAFVPVLRFTVTSDVHIRNDTAALNGHEQLAKFYKTAYAYSDNHPVYDQLDAMFFLGDNTQTGSEQQQTYFFNYLEENTRQETYALASMGNHEFKATGQNYNDPEGATAKFLEYSGYETTDTRFELGGYQFIVFAPDRYNKTKNLYFTEEKLAWVKKELDAAVAATPDKPIFVMQHQPPYETMKGTSGTAGDKGLKELLSNYPQVIDFSGHTHCTLSDPRIIWQDAFTAITTGGLAYLSVPIMNGTNDEGTSGRAIDEEGGWVSESEDSAVRNAGMYYIVEVDAKSTVRVQIYNMFTESLWGEPFILDSIDPADFVYTNDRINQAVQPTFAPGDQLQLRINNYKNLMFTIPQATCKDVVQSYRIEVYQGSTLKQTLYRLAGANYGEAAPERVNAYVKNLSPNTAYTIKVYATSSYNVDSTPLTMNVTTGSTAATPKADALDVVFLDDGTAVNSVTGDALKTYGAPTVYYDRELKKNVAAFDGIDDAYGFWGISNWYDVIGTSYTLETYAYLDKKPASGSGGIVANLQSASIGFTYNADGNVYFYSRLKSDAYNKPGVVVAPGSWVHLTGTYDGATLRFYINGVLMAEEAIAGTLVTPAYMARCMYLGADCNVDARESFFTGKIASAKLYTAPLTAQQVQEQYLLATAAEPQVVCPEHTTDTWVAVTADQWKTGGELQSGHYVLTEDIALAAALNIPVGREVCIDLAGHNITASGAATGADTWYRVFENYGKLTIVDSAVKDGTISGGTVYSGEAIAEGGNIYTGENTKLNVYSGNITGGIAAAGSDTVSGSFGGNIYGAANSEINIYGGRIEKGTATKQGAYTSNHISGGNIGSNGTVRISGGTIIGGAATNTYTDTKTGNNLSLYGGNIAMRDGGDLYITGGMILDGVLSGTRTNNSGTCKAYGRGGNISVSKADLTITGGLISGGMIQVTANGKASGTTVPANASAFGGNVYAANSDVNISGGTIHGGILDSVSAAVSASTSTGKAKVTANGGNLYITEGVVANITGGTISGGQAKHNSKAGNTETMGGNIFVANGGAVVISGGKVIDGYSYYRGGNIAFNDASQVTVTGNALVENGTIGTHSSNCYGENVFMTGTNSLLTVSGNAQLHGSGDRTGIFALANSRVEVTGGNITGGIMIAGTSSSPNASLAVYGGFVDMVEKNSSVADDNLRLYNGRFAQLPTQWLAECTCYYRAYGEYILWHKGAQNGTCTCAYDYSAVTLETGKHTFAATETAGTIACHCGDTKTGILALAAGEGYTTLAAAFAEAPKGAQVQLLGNVTESGLTAAKTLILDLNGYSVNGDLTATNGAVVMVKDSKTDDYTVADGIYGKITGKLTGVIPAEGYVAVDQSYHKLTQRISRVSVRPSVAGIYYGATWECDEILAAQVTGFGMGMSLRNMPASQLLTDPDTLTTGFAPEEFVSGKEQTGAIVENIFKAGQDNDARGKQAVYAVTYVTFADGTVLISNGTAYSLYGILHMAEETAYDANKSALESFYATWKTPLQTWNFEKIGK